MAEYNWHEDFFNRKVLPQICKDAGDCPGFFAWLEVADKQRYDELTRLEQIIESIWLASGDREQFRQACRDWYKETMLGIEKWRAAMAAPVIVSKPAEPKQERLL